MIDKITTNGKDSLSGDGGIQTGQAGDTKIPLFVPQPRKRTRPDLVLEFFFPGVEVPHGVA